MLDFPCFVSAGNLLVLCFFFSTISITLYLYFFFFNDPATPDISPLPLHDALPIFRLPPLEQSLSMQPHEPQRGAGESGEEMRGEREFEMQEKIDDDDSERHQHLPAPAVRRGDRKSTRLNSSHLVISYAVFSLKKKK